MDNDLHTAGDDIMEMLLDFESPSVVVALTATTTVRRGRGGMLRCIDELGDSVGLLYDAQNAEKLAVCETGVAQVAAAVVGETVCVWEMTLPGDNIALKLPLPEGLDVTVVAVNQEFLAVGGEDGIAIVPWDSVAQMPAAKSPWTTLRGGASAAVVGMRWDAVEASALWVATATGPRLIDARLGPLIAPLAPIHAPGSPWTSPELLEEATRLSVSTPDIATVCKVRSRQHVGPAVLAIAGAGGRVAIACQAVLYVCDASKSTCVAVELAALDVAVSHHAIALTGGSVHVCDFDGIALATVQVANVGLHRVIGTLHGARIAHEDCDRTLVFA